MSSVLIVEKRLAVRNFIVLYLNSLSKKGTSPIYKTEKSTYSTIIRYVLFHDQIILEELWKNKLLTVFFFPLFSKRLPEFFRSARIFFVLRKKEKKIACTYKTSSKNGQNALG